MYQKTISVLLAGLMALTVLPSADASTAVTICPPNQDGNMIQVCIESHIDDRNVRMPSEVDPTFGEKCIIFNLCVPMPKATVTYETHTVPVYVFDGATIIIDLCASTSGLAGASTSWVPKCEYEFGTGSVHLAELTGATLATDGSIDGLLFTFEDGSNLLLPVL